MELKKMTVSAITEYLKKYDDYHDLPQEFLRSLQQDDRLSVNKIYHKIEKHKRLLKIEEKRLKNLFNYERHYWDNNYNIVAGVDEAGRGPLAGPVVACAVVFSKETFIHGLNDSKKVSAAKRYLLEQEIIQKAAYYHISIVDNITIDLINIQNASFEAMKNALAGLPIKPDFVLVDGFKIPQLSYNQLAVVKGDQLSASIAAASILAKCTRDRLMLQYNLQYPPYKFDSNKGYGTKEHYQAIETCGISPIHRKTFLG